MPMLELGPGDYWIGTGRGLVRLDHTMAVADRFTAEDGLPNNWVHTLHLIDERTLLVGTQGGPVLLDLPSRRLTEVNLGDHPGARRLDQFVLSAFRDQSDVLWLGTAGALARVTLGSDRFTKHLYPGHRAISVAEDAVGRLWLGGNDGRLRYVDWETQQPASMRGREAVAAGGGRS